MDAGPLAVKQDFCFKRRKICSGEGMQQAAPTVYIIGADGLDKSRAFCGCENQSDRNAFLEGGIFKRADGVAYIANIRLLLIGGRRRTYTDKPETVTVLV